MNRDEAKSILLLYRPGLADDADPQIAKALALAKQDAELARWLDEHCVRQNLLREKFRQIDVPAGLMEQIISEQAAHKKMTARPKDKLVAALAVAAIVVCLVYSAQYWLPRSRQVDPADVSFATYQSQMAYIATSGYGMSLATNDPALVRDFLAHSGAPADYVLPAPLEKTAVTGCAIEGWNGKKVSLICFRTGRPLPPNQAGDLWLFVVDRAYVKDAPAAGSVQFSPAGQLLTAVWTQDGKLYLLAMAGDEAALQKFL